MMETTQQLAQQIGISQACHHLGVPRSSLYRARQLQKATKPRPTPARALSDQERDAVRQVLNSERFVDKAPRQVYATLLDEGQYLCHWRTMYRIMAQFGENRERRNQLRHPTYAKPELVATGPNKLWSWDITKLKGPTKYSAFYLYVIIDVYSRFVVGWLLAEKESEMLAQQLISQTCRNQGIAREQLTLHADRGGAMRAKSVAQLLSDLGVTKSHARPHTPDDNPFSEAHFKTLKYQPDYPDRFVSFQEALAWTRSFITFYNFDHYHSALSLLTPAVVHYGLADHCQAQRQQVLQAAYQQHPERFVKGVPALTPLPTEVWINQPPDQVIVL
jgi:putative transposase